MSVTVQQFIDMVRSRHPAFSRYMVPDKALADFATTEQQRLMTLAVSRDRRYLAQSLSILFDLTHADADAPGTAGAGTTGGVPAVSDGAGGYSAVQATTGSAVAVDAGDVLVSDTLVSAATGTTLTGTGVAWTVNAFVNKVALIVAGKGAGQAPRTITSNTSSQATVSAAWETTPDTTSLFRIVTPVASLDGTLGAVTDLPATTVTRGYLVKLNASGVPYLDYTSPLVAHVSRGVPLPQYHAVLGGTVRFRATDPATSARQDYGATPLTLVHEAMRHRPPCRLAAYVSGAQLFLIGGRQEWEQVESLELAYVPVPTAFTARTDYFLLPDVALPCLTARGALFAASRITGVDGVPQPPADLLAAEAREAEAQFLTTISLTKRARIGRVRPGGS